MFIRPLSADARPSVLFRAECSANISFREGYLCARRTTYPGAPSGQDFDDHLSWRPFPTRFLSFGTWRVAMKRRETLENDGRRDIVVIAVWVENLTGVYSAEEAACKLGYSDTEPDPRRKLRHHRDEYLIEGGIVADEYRILAVFEGAGPEREVVFACPSYQISATIPIELFPGKGSSNALADIENEIYRRSGVRDNEKRNAFVKAFTGSPII